jgi:hypothetical protein
MAMLATMPRKLTDLEIVENSGVDHPAHQVEGWMVMKSLEEALNAADRHEPLEEQLEGNVEETTNLPDEMETEATQDDEVTLEIPVVEETVESELEPVAASVDGPDQEALAKELADLRKEAEEANALAKSLMDERDENAAIAKAKEWNFIPAINANEFGPVLKSLRHTSPEGAAVVEKILDSTNATLSESDFFTELGSAGRSGEDSAAEELDAMVKAAVLNGDAPNYAEGMTRVTATNPALAQRYAEEQRRR